MSRDCWTRSKTLVVAAVLAALAIGVVGPSMASAKYLSGALIEFCKPKSASKTQFSMKTRVSVSQLDSSSKVYVFRGNKTKNRFRIASKRGTYKRVGYSAFVRYFSKESWCPIGSVDYAWKTDPQGKRYRYIRKVDASLYAD